MKLFVNTADFVSALRAVLPHAHASADMPALHCVQFTVEWENIYVTATNNVTAGMGLVSLWEREGLTGALTDDKFTLGLDRVKDLLRFFKAKPKPENELDDQLSIEITGTELTVTDVSGIFPGKSVTWPQPPSVEHAPNLVGMFAARIDPQTITPTRMITQGKFLKIFADAARAYDEPIVVEPQTSEKSLLIACGESFLGLLMQVSIEEGDAFAEELRKYREGWRARLPGVAAGLDEL